MSRFLLAFALLSVLVGFACADWVTTTVAVESQPVAVVVNPVTNRIYVANSYDSTVTVIDGTTNGTTNVRVGLNPYALAANPVTNKIYVANEGSNTITVIDGGTNGTTTLGGGASPGPWP